MHETIWSKLESNMGTNNKICMCTSYRVHSTHQTHTHVLGTTYSSEWIIEWIDYDSIA